MNVEKHIGKRVAFELFNMHNGILEVEPSFGSESAFLFWKDIINDYTNNNNIFQDGIFIFQSKSDT